ncbi:hypothetical protein RS130_22905 [Paraglaciecola aquimarina]|uniref:Uncharacterized protein n=1 Tax=Paraglaciecola aquimarina TaxID=1235557 RepID=A0ABU3T2A7_9ALTE|nr:hypothetical protein [Paraglaciecola aquimarina]MDU0356360.1 hypothetical protein [Paraglaciecola aquimarina]
MNRSRLSCLVVFLTVFFATFTQGSTDISNHSAIKPSEKNSLFMDFNFIDDKIENGFGDWYYADKGKNPCGVYNGHKTSKLCSADNLKLYLYYNYYNNDHMGWTRYGYIDSDNSFAISGSSLKVTLTGGAYPNQDGELSHLGKPIFSKSDYSDENDYGNNPSVPMKPEWGGVVFKRPDFHLDFFRVPE